MAVEGERVIEMLYNEASDVLTLRRSDGSYIRVIDLQDVAVATEIVGPFSYNLNATLNPPPSNSQIRCDSAVLDDVTKIWISNIDNKNFDERNFLLIAKPEDVIYIQDQDNSKAYRTFDVASVPSVQDPAYVSFDVSFRKQSEVAIQGLGVLFGIVHKS